MIRFAFHDDSGRIVQTGTARSLDEVPAVDGLTAIEVEPAVTDMTHRVENGAVVEIGAGGEG